MKEKGIKELFDVEDVKNAARENNLNDNEDGRRAHLYLEVQKEHQKKRARRKRLGIFVALLTCVAVTTVSWVRIMGVCEISMMPTYEDGAKVLVIGTPFTAYESGDVVIAEIKDDNYIKRIIAEPGQHIKIKEGKVYVDEKELDEPYVGGQDTLGETSLVMGEGEYFLLGDNRMVSIDSRAFGPVKGSDFIGKVVLKISEGE